MIYLDSSAMVKLLRKEPETAALQAFLDDAAARPAGTSSLAETEVRSAALRTGLSQARVTRLLDQLEIVDVERSVFSEAGLLPGRALRSLDAIHIAVALREDSDAFVTYDERQAAAAAACGLRVVTPA
ncbi:type II toxin-antitoxin system VapC family toxin [Microbacterium sp. No. 7]|uniref:type II toxin-antitoxin system VapC family toxin n=1 Tax=Microbacterium sp. No. 7 TaxID=1714373 RepID=UPI0006D2830B|nr:type II toxin-antitoxin system VapC family toxin [Microbacterium sp. No. 7]ALJ19656.1 hypothetical protein AOA12_06935 [Microbacterium sp. No. 7]